MKRPKHVLGWVEATLWVATLLYVFYWFRDLENIGRAAVFLLILAASILANAANWLRRHKHFSTRDILVATTWVAVFAAVLVALNRPN
jgi:hypothetical protein